MSLPAHSASGRETVDGPAVDREQVPDSVEDRLTGVVVYESRSDAGEDVEEFSYRRDSRSGVIVMSGERSGTDVWVLSAAGLELVEHRETNRTCTFTPALIELPPNLERDASWTSASTVSCAGDGNESVTVEVEGSVGERSERTLADGSRVNAIRILSQRRTTIRDASTTRTFTLTGESWWSTDFMIRLDFRGVSSIGTEDSLEFTPGREPFEHSTVFDQELDVVRLELTEMGQ